MPREACADSGYGSEGNYSFMEGNGVEAYVKYNWFHKEQGRGFGKDIFRLENLHYNKERDYYVCPMGQHMERVGTVDTRTDGGFVAQSAVYRAARCEGCPLRWGCHKGKASARTITANHTASFRLHGRHLPINEKTRHEPLDGSQPTIRDKKEDVTVLTHPLFRFIRPNLPQKSRSFQRR